MNTEPMKTRILVAAELSQERIGFPASLPIIGRPLSWPREERFFERIQRRLKQVTDDDCRTLRNLWMLNTESPIEKITDYLKASEPYGRFILVPFSGAWQAVDTKTEDDCFKKPL
jgi:hypothetical protein